MTHDLAYYTVTAVTGVLYYVKVDGGAEQPIGGRQARHPRRHQARSR